MGAFLVSGVLKDGKVEEIKIYSEAGGKLKMILPWENGATLKNNDGKTKLNGNTIEINTSKGEVLLFSPFS